MAGYLSTHILDTARGCPAEGVRIELFRLSGASIELIRTLTSNEDGRTNELVMPADEFAFGSYQLLFHAGAYLDRAGQAGTEPRFLDEIPIRFGVSDPDAHYHVPLLLSPFGYSTYRGS